KLPHFDFLLRSLQNVQRRQARAGADREKLLVSGSRAIRKIKEPNMEIVLYYALNTCALAPYVTLTEANASFEVKPLNFRKNEQRLPAYLRLNPKHKVPLLMVDGDPLTESPAIQIWIARNFPQAKLLPSDPWQELKAISILSWCSSGIHPYLSRINSPSRVCGLPNAEQSVIQAAREFLFENYKIAE